VRTVFVASGALNPAVSLPEITAVLSLRSGGGGVAQAASARTNNRLALRRRRAGQRASVRSDIESRRFPLLARAV